MLELLTLRQRDVLKLFVEGLTTDEIAKQLFIAPRTVERHISDIYGIFGFSESDTNHRVKAVKAATIYLRETNGIPVRKPCFCLHYHENVNAS